MSSHRTIKEFRQERASQSKQRFLSLHPSPVLLTAGSLEVQKPAIPGNSGFHTVSAPDKTEPSVTINKKSPLVATDSFLVIPILKREGNPFPQRVGVGRTKGTDITLADREISKYQGYFSSANDCWYFTDGGSSNGTFIRGERLVPMVSTQINDGEELGFGSKKYLFRTAEGFCDFVGK